MRLGIIIAAAVVYVGITLGCMFTTTADPARPGVRAAAGRHTQVLAERKATLPFRGIAVQLQRVDWMETEYRKSVDEVAALGADTVMFVVDSRMENGGSTRIFLDQRLTPSAEQLGKLIDYAKGKSLRVVLMPIVLIDNPRSYKEWRGTISPDGGRWDEWWKSYRSLMHHYAWIAEAHKADVLVVGSELVSTESQEEQWRTTIDGIRKTFSGMLTYSSNWDHYRSVPFWDQLDLVGMNSYWKMGDNHRVSVEQIQQRWKEIQKNVIGFSAEVRKPLLFLEVGWCSLRNAAHEPWDYTKDAEPIDLDLQKRLYEAFFSVWHGTPGLGGFMIWEWTAGDGGEENRGYTPEGKPAEKVLRQWMARPKWQVE